MLTIQCAARCWLAKGEFFEKVFACEFFRADFSAAAQNSTRKLTPNSVTDLLEELARDPEVAAFCAYNDFPYKGKYVEREYWLAVSGEKLSSGQLHATARLELEGKDGYLILHVHYAGEWPWHEDYRRRKVDCCPHREIITQINIRHTWHGSGHE